MIRVFVFMVILMIPTSVLSYYLFQRRAANNKTQILRLVVEYRGTDGVTAKEISQRLGIKPDKVNLFLGQLISEDLLIQSGQLFQVRGS